MYQSSIKLKLASRSRGYEIGSSSDLGSELDLPRVASSPCGVCAFRCCEERLKLTREARMHVAGPDNTVPGLRMNVFAWSTPGPGVAEERGIGR